MVDQSVTDIDAGMVDVVKADIFAMVARPDFHHRDHPLELPVQFDVTLHDDGVGQEGVAVGAEAQHRITVFQLGGHHDGHAHGREYRDHAIQRFAEIFAEYRRQCQFEAGQRVDDDALGLHRDDHLDQIVQDFVDRQIERARIDHADLARADHLVQRLAEQLVRTLLECRDDARFAQTHALGQELRRQHGLARARRSDHQQRVAGRDAATHHAIELGHAGRQALIARDAELADSRAGALQDGAREDLDAIVADPEGVYTQVLRLAAHLDDLDLAHQRIAVYLLRHPDDAVGHGEDGAGLRFGRQVFADQEGGGQPARHLHAELLHEVLQAGGAEVHALGRLHHRAEGVDEHQARRKVAHLVGDARQHPVEIALEQISREVDELDRLVDLADVEEWELLLVAQHLQRRFAEHREKQRAPFRRGQREHDLVRHRRLAAAGRAGQQVEGKLRDTATEQVIQAANSSGQALYSYLVSHCCGSLPAVSTASVSQAECKMVVVNGSPISRIRESMKTVSNAMLISAAWSGVCSSRWSLSTVKSVQAIVGNSVRSVWARCAARP